MMKQTIPLLAAASFVVAGLASSPSQAHGVVTATVGLPPVTVGVGGLVVTVGEPPPPPPRRVVVVQPAPPPVERVVYVEEPAPPPSVVYVHPRDERVIYVDDRDDCHGHHPHGKAYGYWKKHGGYHR